MATRIIDLDVLLPEDKHVRMGGKVYILPGDLPVELYLKVQEATRVSGEVDTSVEDLRAAMIELLQIRNRSITKLPAGMGMAQMVTLITNVYMGGDDAAPKAPRTGGATRSTSRSRSRSPR